jgi:hypothetical protein
MHPVTTAIIEALVCCCFFGLWPVPSDHPLCGWSLTLQSAGTRILEWVIADWVGYEKENYYYRLCIIINGAAGLCAAGGMR